MRRTDSLQTPQVDALLMSKKVTTLMTLAIEFNLPSSLAHYFLRAPLSEQTVASLISLHFLFQDRLPHALWTLVSTCT